MVAINKVDLFAYCALAPIFLVTGEYNETHVIFRLKAFLFGLTTGVQQRERRGQRVRLRPGVRQSVCVERLVCFTLVDLILKSPNTRAESCDNENMNVVGVAGQHPNAMAAVAGSCTESDIRQIERFFNSLKSRVYVCPALANLYFTTLQDMANLGGWELQTTGFPTLIFENRQNERRLLLCIAEKGTGFVQWKDALTPDSKYKSPETNFHTLNVSGDALKLAGLSFDNEQAAAELMDTVNSWMNEIALDSESNSRKKKKKHKEPKIVLPKKETISQPCLFEHITNLDHDKFVKRMMVADDNTIAPPLHFGVVPENGDTSKMLAYAESTSTEDSGLDELHE